MNSIATNHKIWPQLNSHRIVFAGLFSGLMLIFLLSLILGSVKIPLGKVIAILLGYETDKTTWASIILKFRLPKALTAMLAGSALAVSGLQMQTLFRNPLADPFVLGISSGASLGVALVVLTASTANTTLLAGFGLLGDFGLFIAASLGSAIVLGMVLVVSRKIQNNITLLILGLMFGYAAWAMVSILIYFSVPERIQSYLNWTFGSFGGVTWRQMKVLAPTVILGLIITQFSAKPLNALLLGENYARSLGLTIKKARFWIITSASILAGTITAFCGPIAFLGVAVPHLCRGLFNTSDHRILVPAVTLMGALLALLFDLIAQMPGSQNVLPLNAVTALFGAPIVIGIILRQKNLN